MARATSDIRSERRIAVISLVTGIVLMLVKLTAYWLTDSAAILSDALESTVNVLASGFALYAIVLASEPPDSGHPYGHGKVEFLSAGFEGGMIFVAALLILVQAISDLVRGPTVQDLEAGLALMALAMLTNGLVGVRLVRQGRRSGSLALEADGRHLLSDSVTSLVVLAALVVVRFTGLVWIDPAAAIVVALYIVWTAVGLLRRSTAGPMDEQDVADDTMIREVLDAHVGRDAKPPQVCSYDHLRHRHVGRHHWIDFRIRVPADWDIALGHRVATELERAVERALGPATAAAHVEPCDADTCRVCRAPRDSSAVEEKDSPAR